MTGNLQMCTNDQIKVAQRDIWDNFWVKYRGYSKEELLKDNNIAKLIEDADHFFDKYPFELATNLVKAYLDELCARANGKYYKNYKY